MGKLFMLLVVLAATAVTVFELTLVSWLIDWLTK